MIEQFTRPEQTRVINFFGPARRTSERHVFERDRKMNKSWVPSTAGKCEIEPSSIRFPHLRPYVAIGKLCFPSYGICKCQEMMFFLIPIIRSVSFDVDGCHSTGLFWKVSIIRLRSKSWMEIYFWAVSVRFTVFFKKNN